MAKPQTIDDLAPSPRKHELTTVLNRQFFDAPPAENLSLKDLRRWRAFRAAYHKAQSLEVPGLFPLQVDFELCSSCTMHCSFCTHGHTRVVPRRLPFSAFANAIDEGQSHGLCSVKFNYINEPLLVPNLAAHIEYARAHGVLNTYLATNGQLLTEQRGRELIEAGLSKLMVSLDATTSETFMAMRQSHHFAMIVENVHAFIALRNSMGCRYPFVRVNFLRTSVNQHELPGFIDQWSGKADMIGVQDCVAIPGVDSGAGHQNQRFQCSFPFKLVVVDSAGRILPCCTFSGREMPIGMVTNGSIGAAYQSQRAQSLRQQHIDGRLNLICQHCLGRSNTDL